MSTHRCELLPQLSCVHSPGYPVLAHALARALICTPMFALVARNAARRIL
jgi:hypothetical protein